MFVFGHVGIGRRLVGSRGRSLPAVPLLVGMMLPDLIDKPLYYTHAWSFVSCTRTFGHTGLLMALVYLLCVTTRSRPWLALGLGMSTHVAIDWIFDLILGNIPSAAAIAFAWPFWHTTFAVYDISPLEHLGSVLEPPILIGELVGFTLLVLEYLKRRPRRI